MTERSDHVDLLEVFLSSKIKPNISISMFPYTFLTGHNYYLHNLIKLSSACIKGLLGRNTRSDVECFTDTGSECAKPD